MPLSPERVGPVVLALMAALVIAPPAPARAEPVTLYKPADIANARANVERYEWAREVLEGYRRRVAYVMEQDRAWIEEMVPDLTPGSPYGQVCPRCVGEQCSEGETGVLTWSVTDPDRLTCRYCGATYPDPEYPETGTITAPRMGQSFSFYVRPEEAAHPEDRSGKYAYRWASWPVHVSFSGLIRLNKASYVAGRALPLAKLYALTGEVQYAERCAWILDRLARAYPGWLYHTYFGTVIDMPPAEVAAEYGAHPRAGNFAPEVLITAFPDDPRSVSGMGFWGAGRLHAGVGGEGSFLLDCTVAYDLIRDARRADGTEVLTAEMDERIRRDLIDAGCTDLENYASIDNKCGPGRALSAAVGQLFGQPERVRRGLEGATALLEQCFHFDGFCVESPSYSSMHLGGLYEILDLLAGYSDPPGYQPAEGERFDNLNPYEDLPRYRLALLSMVRMLRPDLKYPVIGDTHAGGGISSLWAEILADNYGPQYAGLLETVQGAPLAERGSAYALWNRPADLVAPEDGGELPLRSEWFPGWHVAVLRNGHPHGRNAFYFNAYESHGHRHYDGLGIAYYALDRELASDRGYIWDDPRNAWTRSTYAHNLVVVDGENQAARDRTSTLELFAVAPGIEVVQASANAYAQCSQYRRTCALVQLPGDNSYAVDIFRVTGGALHQYCLNCHNAGAGEFTLADLETEPEEGMIAPGSLRWGMTNLRVARPTGMWRARWHEGGVGLDLLMATPLDRLVVTDAPGWRSNKGSQLNAPPITEVVAERTGADLASTFCAVLSPWEGEGSPVLAMREVHPEPDDGTAVAVVVELEGGRTDWVISALDDRPRDYGPVTMAGRFGFVSLGPDGALRAAYLHEGTELRVHGDGLELDRPRITRAVAAVSERTITLAEPLPAGLELAGRYILAGDTGYEVESADATTLVVRDYPVAACDEVVIPMSVWRQAEGGADEPDH